MTDKNHQVEHAIEHLKEHKIIITPQRNAIITLLANSTSHPTVENIYEELLPQYPSMSMATVYNTIKMLKEHNMIKEIHVDEPSIHYDFNVEEHYHVVCKSCGKIVDVSVPLEETFGETFENKSGFKIDTYDLKLKGLCRECQIKLGDA